jgi:hypothetical protein
MLLAALAAAGCAGRPGAAAVPPPAADLVAPGCRWERVTGGGLGFWAQACDLATGRWRVAWDPGRGGFELQVDGRAQALVVQPWPIPAGGGPAAIVAALAAAGHLPADARCVPVPVTPRPLPAGVVALALVPATPVPAVTASGEVPAPSCGDYGASTHGIRYFLVDALRPQRAVFVDEGQDQPLFAPASIVAR